MLAYMYKKYIEQLIEPAQACSSNYSSAGEGISLPH